MGSRLHRSYHAVLPDGCACLTSFTNCCVKRFTGEGDFLTRWGSHGSGTGESRDPYGLAVDMSTGYLYVTEWVGNRVSKYGPAPSPAAN